MPDYSAIIRQAKYIAPSGAEIVMQFDDVERSSGKKFAVHELPQQDTPIVQDQGNQARRYPFACYLSGDTAYADADALDAALSEIGPGTFEHPMFGNLEVLATTWAESRKLVEGLGRVDFSIEFVQAPKVKPLSSSTGISLADNLTKSIDEALAESTNNAASDFIPANAAEKAKSKKSILSVVQSYSTAFREAASGVSDVATSINRQVSTITNTIDDLIEAPLELFNALATLAKTPANITTNIANKIAAYREQAVSIFESIPDSYYQALASLQSLFYSLGGACEASTIGDLPNRSIAIAAADSLGEFTSDAVSYIETVESSVPGFSAYLDTISVLIDSASLARRSLAERAFSLRSERRVTLDVETTPLNLIALFYGDTAEAVPDLDATLDEIITINNLQGDAISLVPAGREVVYYV